MHRCNQCGYRWFTGGATCPRCHHSTGDDELPLFDGDALSRRGDPESSKDAGRDIVASLSDLHRWAVACVTETPGLTQAELGRRYCPDDPRRIGRRLAECERLGLLYRKSSSRKCSITGRLVDAWFPVDDDRHLSAIPTQPPTRHAKAALDERSGTSGEAGPAAPTA